MKRHYFDYAAATPMDKSVLKAMMPYLTDRFANPSSLHTAGRDQRKTLESARADIAKVIGAKPAEIYFTSGSTEAAHIAIQGAARQAPGSRLVAAAIEHETVLQTINALESEGHHGGAITVNATGVVDPEQAAAVIDDATVLVALQYVNNELGTVQPVAKVAAAMAAIRSDRAKRGIVRPLYLYCDAAQAGLMNINVARLGVDMLSIGGSKLYGPSGSGFLYIRSGTELWHGSPGGGQERGLRSGTENVAAAVGLAQALQLAQKNRVSEAVRQGRLRDQLWTALSEIEDVDLNGDRRQRSPGYLNIQISGADGETLVAYLDKEGYAVATGSACTAANQDPSHVLLAIGQSPKEAQSSLRITLGRPTTLRDVDGLAKAIIKVVPRVRELSDQA